jgi:hypothetical protein
MKPISAYAPAPLRPRLSDALAASTALARLQTFALATGCDPLDLSIDQGKTLDLDSVLETMRRRGYVVGDLVRPQAQARRDVSAWTFTVGVHGVQVTLALYLADPA